MTPDGPWRAPFTPALTWGVFGLLAGGLKSLAVGNSRGGAGDHQRHRPAVAMTLSSAFSTYVVACPGLPPLRARDMSAPDPETARYEVSTATVTGAICRVPI